MRRVWFIAAAALLAAGCGSDGPELPVNGVVTWDGAPMDGATVTFWPDEEAGGTTGTAQTGSDGKFVIVGAKGQKGLPAGQYRVTVSKMKFRQDEEPDPSDPAVGAVTGADVRDELPAIYSDPSRTILKYSVTGDGKPIEIKLDSKRKK